MSKRTQNLIGGTLMVADSVISDLIGYAALETFGVVGMAAPSFQDGFVKLLPARALRRGVTMEKGEDGLLIHLYVIIEHGVNLMTVSKNLIDRVRFVIENYADQKIADIAVHVQGIRVSKSN